eukprot:6885341-Pyramimonas_sp.AAC.1
MVLVANPRSAPSPFPPPPRCDGPAMGAASSSGAASSGGPALGDADGIGGAANLECYSDNACCYWSC